MRKFVLQGSPKEITDRKYIADGKVKQIVERYFIDPASKKAKLVWEYITGFIFTNDGYTIQTNDNYTIKTNDL